MGRAGGGLRDAPGREAREGRQDITRAAILAVLALCAAGSVLLTALLVYPFSPYRVYGTNITLTTVCPGDDVSVTAESEIEAGWEVRSFETESVWRPLGSREGEVPESGGSGVILAPEPRERGVVESPIIRNAPDHPGSYRLHTRATVYGTFEGGPFRGFPKTQRIEYESQDVLTVEEPSAPECQSSPEAQAAAGNGAG